MVRTAWPLPSRSDPIRRGPIKGVRCVSIFLETEEWIRLGDVKHVERGLFDVGEVGLGELAVFPFVD